MENKRREARPKQFNEEMIELKRVTKVTKGGRHFRFAATMAVGDGKGLIGLGTGKANEVPDAIKKAVQAATKNVVKVSLVDDRTIPHEAIGVQSASRVLLKPAQKGTGVKDILSKSLGSNTKINMAYARLNALKAQKTAEQVAAMRGKKVEEIL